jgi:uncharacterized OB-fold protein
MSEETRPFTEAAFNQYLNEKKLMASYNSASDSLYLPPRAICPKTHDENMEWRELSGKGKLVAFTSINIGLSMMNELGFGRDNPYCSGIVELEEGVKISAFIRGVDPKQPASIKIGSPVTVDFWEIGEGEEKQTRLAFKVED